MSGVIQGFSCRVRGTPRLRSIDEEVEFVRAPRAVSGLDDGLTYSAGKEILCRLGVPLSDVERLLAGAEAAVDTEYVKLQQSLRHFSLGDAWNRQFALAEEEQARKEGKRRLAALGLPSSDIDALMLVRENELCGYEKSGS